MIKVVSVLLYALFIIDRNYPLLLVSFLFTKNMIHTTIGWLPVRSAVLKPHAGELVVGWVTTSESSLLYVLIFLKLLWFIWKVLFAALLSAPSAHSPKYPARQQNTLHR
ncbi:L-lysine 2-3-aminomutase [Penicillium rubens]|uniref:L-lysine 2-3-aminomutase n=1 Tax=Penicillium rubens TaxID=1108849 RepID=UPI002A5A4775|nr:L-lysine 2-3-aminomutase [Penicillium rubens]KAJ5831259.1 L-lysine 2-3-aminomutase [Penicillium rubens]KAJ5854802.1 L-lysine 2-3-aminomutase [Penicillium rubens]